MSYLINNQQNMNEVIFADRNKNYGAYAIRSAYGNTIFKSLSFMILGFGTFMSLAFYFSNRNTSPDQKSGQLVMNDSNIVTIFDIKPEEILPKSDEQSKNENKTTASATDVLATKINDSLSVETVSIAINEPTEKSISTNSSTSNLSNNGSFGGTETSSLTSPSTGSVATSELYLVDSAPEFDGGIKALYKFISSNVNYPPTAIEVGKEGTVFVKFVVDETGKVGNLNLLNSLGFGMDDEALRVVAMIPKFKSPAKINGKAVKVYYQLPIKYKLR